MKSLLNDALKKVSKETLEHFYIELNLTKQEVAEKLELTPHTLDRVIKEYGIKKPMSLQLEKRKATCMKKYGVDNPSHCPEVVEKIKATNQERYGANSFTATEQGKNKILQTKLERYGSSNYCNLEKVLQTKLERYGDKNYNNRDKMKQTCLQRYGVDNGAKLQSSKDSSIEKLCLAKGYSELFRSLISNKEASEQFVKQQRYTLDELCRLFNAKLYIVSSWVNRFSLNSYISYKFNGKSRYEEEIVEFIKSLNIENIICNSQDILPNKQEIDIYLPDYKVGIEFNGTYWHSDAFKDKYYHEKKSKSASECNIRLIHVYEYEWVDIEQQVKIKSIIATACGKIQQKIQARNCIIKHITDNEAKKFNNVNHIQKHRSASVTYGLYYNNELVQLMSFSKHSKYQWEIIRSCTKNNAIVVGGVSKLFTHFIKEYNPDTVFSYCDLNKFNGRGYEELEMQFIGYTGPDLKYIFADGTVLARNPNKYREYEESSIGHIYGAGSKKYIYSKQI